MYVSTIMATISIRIHCKYTGKLTHEETWHRYIWTIENFVHGSENTSFEIMIYLNRKDKGSTNDNDK
jgi:hypothetical protein